MSDPYFANVTLHLPFNAYALGGMLPDYSPPQKLVDLVGGAALSSTQSKFGGKSLHFDGSTYMVSGPSSDFGFGAGDFTVEFWVYFSSLAGDPYLMHFSQDASNRYALQLQTSSNKLSLYRAVGGVSQTMIEGSVTGIVTGQWYHIALVRASGSTAIYVDGAVSLSPQTVSAMSWASSTMYVGNALPAAASNYLTGYIDDLRITKGVARYTSAFTAPGEIEHTPWTVVGSVVAAPVRYRPYEDNEIAFGALSTAKTVVRDTIYGGKGTITGTVKETPNTPVSRRVRLHRTRDGVQVAETWSTEAGDYTFTQLDTTDTYYAVSFDHTGDYRGVVADGLVAS